MSQQAYTARDVLENRTTNAGLRQGLYPKASPANRARVYTAKDVLEGRIDNEMLTAIHSKSYAPERIERVNNKRRVANYWAYDEPRARLAYNTSKLGRWVGWDSKNEFSRAAWNLDRAISGKGNKVRWSSKTAQGTPGPYTINGAARVTAVGRAGDHILSGLWKLPKKTKVLGAVAIGSALFAMRRNKKDKFYTHYFDY